MDLEQMAADAFGQEQTRVGAPPSLVGFPTPLQDVLATEVMKTTPRRATDLWYEDEQSNRMFVLRGGIQWELNPTAAFVWRHVEEGVQSLTDTLKSEHADEDADEITNAVVDFLLQADYYGLVELYPPSLDDDEQ